MDAEVRASSAVNILLIAGLVFGGLVALYYLYTFLYGVSGLATRSIIPGKILANKAPSGLPGIPPIYEGGDYTISFWMYVNSYNVNRNRRKHILEIGGTNFSSLLVGLGAFRNTLMVRTHSREPDGAYAGTDSSGNPAASAAACATPNSSDGSVNRSDGSLSTSEVAGLFKQLAMDDSLLDISPVCDLPEIDLQRWVQVGIVLSGRTIDVYLNGKLTRSCVTKSYYKVDPTGVSLKLLQKAGTDGEAGFDGHLANLSVANVALSPTDMYRIYANGPEGKSTDIFSWVGSLFTGSK